jgi:hypothetical protein
MVSGVGCDRLLLWGGLFVLTPFYLLLAYSGRQGVFRAYSLKTLTKKNGKTQHPPTSAVNDAINHVNSSRLALQGCVFTRDIDAAIAISDAMETGTVQINSAPARGPDHFPFQGFRDSGAGSQGVKNSLELMTKVKSTVINLAKPSYTMG